MLQLLLILAIIRFHTLSQGDKSNRQAFGNLAIYSDYEEIQALCTMPQMRKANRQAFGNLNRWGKFMYEIPEQNNDTGKAKQYEHLRFTGGTCLLYQVEAFFRCPENKEAFQRWKKKPTPVKLE